MTARDNVCRDFIARRQAALRAQSATILPFLCVRVLDGAEGWLVVCGDHGWAHGSRAAAIADARWLSRNYGVPIIDHSRRI